MVNLQASICQCFWLGTAARSLVFNQPVVLALNSAVSVSKWYSQYMSSITKFGSLTTRLHHHWTDDVKPLEFQMEAQDDYVLKGTCLSSPPFLRLPGQFWEGKSVRWSITVPVTHHVVILEGDPLGENPKTINWRLYFIPEKFYIPMLSLKKPPYKLELYRYTGLNQKLGDKPKII